MRSRRIRYTLGLILVVIAQIVSFVTTTELSFVEQNKNLLLYPPQTYSIRRHQQFGNRERRTTNNISDDLIPTDLVLISSLDGSVRGVDRFKGTVYWTLQGGTSGSSVIRSTTHFRTNYDTRQQHADRSMHDESRAFDDYLMDEDEISGQNILVSDDDDAYAEGYEIYYIVEPQNGGTLYIYGEGRPLEKLPFSIQEIVAQSPIRTRRGTTYIGSKSTVMTAVDPRSGKILRKFDLDHSQDAYLMATQNRLPPHTIFLGRHDYKVAIFDNNNQKWWNLTYSEYVPNKLDWDVPESMVASDIYIAPDTTGAITAVKVANGDVLWSLDLHLPVVSVFDVYRRQDFTIALSKQEPPHTLQTGTMGELLSVARQQQGLLNGFVYVGVYEGSLFALSADHYPLVQLSGLAPMYRALPPGETSSPSSNFRFWWNRHADHLSTCKGCKGHVDFLVGRHPVISTDSIPRPETTPNMYPPRRLLPGEYPNRSAPNYTDIKEGFFYDGPGKFWKSYLAAILAICYASRRHLAKFYELYLSQRVKILKKKFDAAKKRRARRSVRISTDKSNAVTTTTTATANLGANEKHKPTVEKEKSDASTTVETTKVETTPVTPTTPAADIQPRRIKASGLEPRSLSEKKPKVLKLSDTILGYGSHGTIVYKGEFDGRAVAVKRLLIDFYDIAFQEVKLLQESDDHPNVVRYFYKEESDRFLYIALELCYGSLHDYMERSLPVPDMQLFDQMDPANILYQIMCGIQHLHSLKIVHRDIKPQNILLAPSKQGANKDKPPLRILLSDFGLCKKLEGEQSSFHYTTASPVGTVGWCAPELLANIAVSASEDNTSSSGSESRNNASGKQVGLPPRGSRAIDIFAAGCVFYYVLSGGDHPFGPRFVRENNILKGDYSLDKLQDMGEDGVEAADLISRMLSQEPKLRPNADVVLAHPFFWTPAKRLAFLQDASDRFEVEQRDPPSPLLQRLESDLDNVIGGNWYRRIDRVVANDLGKFRKYDGKRVRDLLRALRNKKHHWQDLPEQVKATLGEPPDNYLYYFTARFPHLFLHTYYIIADDPDLRAEGSLRQYF